MKYLGVNLIKDVKYIYIESYKALLKQIEKDAMASGVVVVPLGYDKITSTFQSLFRWLMKNIQNSEKVQHAMTYISLHQRTSWKARK